MSKLETRVPAPVVAFVLALLMHYLPRLEPASASAAQLQSWAIDVFINGSGLVALAAFIGFLRAHTTINPMRPERASVLVTGGVYRLTRNPMYLSLLLLLLTYASTLWNWVAFMGPLLYVAYMNRFQIRPEERVLRAKFGAPYVEYTQRVRRWL